MYIYIYMYILESARARYARAGFSNWTSTQTHPGLKICWTTEHLMICQASGHPTPSVSQRSHQPGFWCLMHFHNPASFNVTLFGSKLERIYSFYKLRCDIMANTILFVDINTILHLPLLGGQTDWHEPHEYIYIYIYVYRYS